MNRAAQTALLLVLSNVFMNAAWYGHLKFKTSPLWIAILASWGLAFFEYCLQVPANRIGYGEYSATQLKVMQEAISLGTFLVFAFVVFGEKLRWNQFVSMGLILFAVWLALQKF